MSPVGLCQTKSNKETVVDVVDGCAGTHRGSTQRKQQNCPCPVFPESALAVYFLAAVQGFNF